MEAVIFIGIPGAGKTTFYHSRLGGTHTRISLDELRTRNRERALVERCLKDRQPFVIDNTNVLASERAVYIAAAKAAGFRAIGYFFDVSRDEALRRNAQRSGKQKVPVPGVLAKLKRLQPPSLEEGFDELHVVKPGDGRYRIFLLSPAHAGGERAQLLFRDRANFDLAVRLRREPVPLGEIFAFLSGLYFRGKLAYAERFAAPPPDIPGSFVITAGCGLIPPETPVTLEQLRQIGAVPIDARDARYREPLERACRTLDEIAGPACDFVLLGSVASAKYLDPLCGVFGDRLLFPPDFVGRGDMSRGGLLLRCVQAGLELSYVPAGKVTRHGPRPPKLPKWKR